MAEIVLMDARVEINSVVLSTRAKEVRLRVEATTVDSSAMGLTWSESLNGPKRFSGSVVFEQDYAAASVDATIWALVGAAPVAAKFRATTAAVSATNPEYQGNIIITGYSPLEGRYGEHLNTTVDFQGNGALTRATS